MRTRVRAAMRWMPTLVLLVAACSTNVERSEPLSESPSAPPTASFDDPQAWLELYDEAGFPDVSSLRRVEFEAGRSWSGNDEEPTIHFERAWVLSSSPLVLLRDSLWTFEPEGVEVPAYMLRPRAKTRPHAPDEPLAYREVDFADELRAELEAVEALTEKDDAYEHPFGMDGRLVSRATYWLVRARWAEMRGHPELARRALVQVERWTTIDCREAVCSPRDAIRHGFALALLWQATDGIGDFMPRPQARELVARSLTLAPDAVHAERASELLDRLDRTIATDTDGLTWPDSGDSARAQRLIHLLREQNGQQMSQPGACDPFAVPSSIRNPAAELVALGRDAIPALIDHIDDDTLTRSVGFHRDFHFSHHVLSVGEVSLVIIEQITGRSFYAEQPEKVRAWWASASQLSEREQLLHDLDVAEASQRGRVASRLLEAYGMEIWPELTRAFDETQDEQARRDLLHTMNRVDEAELVERFLIGALDDRSASVRLAAAQALSERERHDGTETIIRDLDVYWQDPHAWSYQNFYGSYFSVLVADGSAAALDAIDRAIQRRGYAALAALSDDACRWHERCSSIDAAAKARLLDTLADYLDEHGGTEGWANGPLRVRDRALSAYGALTGRDLYAFTRDATSIERDRMALELLDAHRAERGQTPVSWPHVAPPEGTPGRDHVQRVHLVRAEAREDAAREWLAGFADREVNPQQITRALVHLAHLHPDVPFLLRVHRFPDDAGVILILEVGPHAPAEPPAYILSAAACGGGADCGVSHSSTLSVAGEPEPQVFASFLHDHVDAAWNLEPTRIEEYMFQVKVPHTEPQVQPIAATPPGCRFTSGDSGDWFSRWGWLLLIASLLRARGITCTSWHC